MRQLPGRRSLAILAVATLAGSGASAADSRFDPHHLVAPPLRPLHVPVPERTTLPNGFKVVSTYTFEDAPEGTRVRLLFTWGKSRREREALTQVRDFIAEVVGQGQAALHDLLGEEMTRRSALAADEPPEPVAPGSKDRELLEPVRR